MKFNLDKIFTLTCKSAMLPGAGITYPEIEHTWIDCDQLEVIYRIAFYKGSANIERCPSP
jgi:hypothetical protein